MLPLIMGGLSLAQKGFSLYNNRKADKRKDEAIAKQVAGLNEAYAYNTKQSLDQVDQTRATAGADIRTRMLQARREAGRTASLSQSAGAGQGQGAESLEMTAYGRAGAELEAINVNTERTTRSIFRDITTSRLTLNNQIAGIESGMSQKANPWLSALSLGAGAVSSYAQYGGEFKSIWGSQENE